MKYSKISIIDGKLGIGFMFTDKIGCYVIVDMQVSCDGYIRNVSLLNTHASGGKTMVESPESVLEMDFMGRVNMTPFYKEIAKVDYMYHSQNSLIQGYIQDRPSTIESYIEEISSIRDICKTMSENLKDKSTGLYQENGLLWHNVYFHLTRALMDLEKIRERNMEV